MAKRDKRLKKLKQNPKNVSPEELQQVLVYYLSLRYQIVLTPEEDGWGALIPDLSGCVGGGDTIEEALAMLEDAKRGWLLSSLAHGDAIPEPSARIKSV